MYTVGIRISAFFAFCILSVSESVGSTTESILLPTHAQSEKQCIISSVETEIKPTRKKICKIFRLAPCFLPFSSLNSEGYFAASQKIKCEEVINVLKTELEVVTVGTPDITALSDDERRVFFETIMARVLELAKERNEL